MTEHVLRSLDAAPSSRIDWTLWGGPAAKDYALGRDFIEARPNPKKWLGQLATIGQPRGFDAICFMHQLRPLLAVPNVTLIHDTTPLHTTTNAAVLAARRAFLRRVAHSSRGILTVSAWSKRMIATELRVAPGRIRVVPNVSDPAFGARVRSIRKERGREPYALYVGALAEHKNIPRLLNAFAASSFSRDGGRLVCVGGDPGQIAELSQSLGPDQLGRVSFLPRCDQPTLDALYAGALMLVQPSLEEGFGLPVREALSAGIPVCASPRAGIEDVAEHLTARFDPRSVTDIARALDEAAATAVRRSEGDEGLAAAEFLGSAPSLEGYGSRFEDAVVALLLQEPVVGN